MVSRELVTPVVFAKELSEATYIPDELGTFVATLSELQGIPIERLIVFDFETYADKPVGIALTNGVHAYFVPATDAFLNGFAKLLKRGHNLIIAHNLKYDLSVLVEAVGMSPVDVRRLTLNNIFLDTLLLHHLLNPEETHKLKVMAYQYTRLGGYEGDIGSSFWKSSLWKQLAESFVEWGVRNERVPIRVNLQEDKEAHVILSSLLRFKEIDIPQYSEWQAKSVWSFTELDDSLPARLMKLIALYSVTDALITLQISSVLLHSLLKERNVRELLRAVILKLPVSLTAIEKRGLLIDTALATEMLSSLEESSNKVVDEINALFEKEMKTLRKITSSLSEKDARAILKSTLGRTPSKSVLLKNFANYLDTINDKKVLTALMRLYIKHAELEDVLSYESVNIRSPSQLQKALRTVLLLNVRNSEDVAVLDLLKSTGEDVLKKVASKFDEEHPLGKIANLILEYRKIFKLISTYISPYLSLVDADNRLHPEFKQHGTVTGRLCLAPETPIYVNEHDAIELGDLREGDEIFTPFSSNKRAKIVGIYHVVSPSVKLFLEHEVLPYEIIASPQHRFLSKIDGVVRWHTAMDIINYVIAGKPVFLIGYEDGEFVEIRVVSFASHKVRDLIDIEIEYEPIKSPFGLVSNAFIANGVVSHNSSVNPNVQNIPKESGIRNLIIPPEGYLLIEADYSQIELRVAAAVADESYMIQSFRDGRDIHRATAALVLKKREEDITDSERRAAKSINFGILYGMGAASLAERLNISVQEAEEFIKAYFKSFPKLKEWIHSTIEFARKHGYVETYFGRRRYLLPDILAPDERIRKNAEREAINTPIQGTASDMTLSSLVKLSEVIPADVFIVNTVHDSIILEVPEHKAPEISQLVQQIMEDPPILTPGHILRRVPIKVDVELMNKWH